MRNFTIDELQHLDKMLAEQIFGYRFESYGNGGGFWHHSKDCKRQAFASTCECGGSHAIPQYTSSLADAIPILAHLTKEFLTVQLACYREDPKASNPRKIWVCSVEGKVATEEWSYRMTFRNEKPEIALALLALRVQC